MVATSTAMHVGQQSCTMSLGLQVQYAVATPRKQVMHADDHEDTDI